MDEKKEAEKKEPMPYTARACRTTYVEENGRFPARVKAKHVTTGQTKFALWDERLDMLENHMRAAKLVLGKRPEVVASEDGGGFVCIAAPEACRLVLLGEEDAERLGGILAMYQSEVERGVASVVHPGWTQDMESSWLGRMREALGGGGSP